MNALKYYKTRYGGFGIVPADSPMVGDAVEVGAARKEEYAKLFAAAPKMLNALEVAEATIKRLERHAPGSANGTLDVIREAIKAGGAS